MNAIACFDSQKPQIAQSSAEPLSIQFAEAPEEPFDSQEINLRHRRSISCQKAAVSTAYLDFQGLVRPKKVGERKNVQVGSRFIN